MGKVTRCASDVPNAERLLGQTVFAFAPHSTYAIVDHNAVRILPNGIDPMDAVFLPAVETALSIVQDARVIPGENVAIFGQGLVGLLVSAILHRTSVVHTPTGYRLGSLTVKESFENDGNHPNNCNSNDSPYRPSCGTITSFDVLSTRRSVSTSLGSGECLHPHYAKISGPFDVCIEVSGNPRALQSAIDECRRGGRVIIASLYGGKDISLKLGLDFHRGQRTIRTSQVSFVPADLSETWDKERRFDTTWEIIRALRPGRNLISRRVGLKDSQLAYELLEEGKEITVAFIY